MTASTQRTRVHLEHHDVALVATWAMWPWLDRAPLGRNEGDMSWFHRHDEYPA